MRKTEKEGGGGRETGEGGGARRGQGGLTIANARKNGF